MKKRMILKMVLCTVVMTFCLITGGVVEGLGDKESNLQGFLSEIYELQKRDNILKRWSFGDIQRVKNVAEKYDLLPSGDELKIVESYGESSAMLLLIFREAYGHKYTWTLEHQVNYQEEMNRLGYNLGNQFILPNENDLSQEEAIVLAQNEILERANQEKYGGYSVEDLDKYRVFCEFIRSQDGSKNWYLKFFSPDVEVWFSEFDVMVAEDGKGVSVTWNDPQMYLNIGYIWKELLGSSFSFWSIEEKYAFYNELLRNKEYQEEKYGTLFGYENTVLNHVHGIPQMGELTCEMACVIADEYIYKQYGVELGKASDLKRALSFYRDDPKRPMFEVRYYKKNKIEHSVKINAINGAIE